ncbi:MAG: hypothetical protein D3926_21060 [Desulfobacteraceae bacterium]|nr:MAG: hypothetical protein D3926_21060 [Desulfobacteraceae bacterium]
MNHLIVISKKVFYTAICILAFTGLAWGAADGEDQNLIHAYKNVIIASPEVTPGDKIEVPVVFVSRNRMANWRHVHIGPPLDVQAREQTPGGSLMHLDSDGTLTDLTEGTGIYDVQQPAVSLGGSIIAFSAVTEDGGKWHIWQINVDGTGLRQLTFDDRSIPIPDDPENPGKNEQVFSRYGDFGPEWLPDGRILFSSTRYMTLSPSCSERGQNLYVLDPDTGTLTRRTTERSGAMDPVVLRDGRVAFSHWVDTVNRPASHGEGLEPLRQEYSHGPNMWGIWVMNPDATDAHRYLFTFGEINDGGGLFQPRELSNGNIVVAARAHSSLLGDTLANGVAVLEPGPVDHHKVTVLGNPFINEAPHALCPAPLPDDRIVVSYTPQATVAFDQNGIRTAEYDFGLYVTDPEFSTLSLVYNDPDRDELDAVAVIQKDLPVIPDIADADLISDDPMVSLGGTAVMTNHNVYADVLPHVSQLPSPRLGTVAYIDVYNDDQSFTTSEDYPTLKKQMPEKVGRFPVNQDGSFSIEVPADEPLLFLLTDADGVAVKSPMSTRRPWGKGVSLTHTFNGHDYLRPGTEITCAGCHKGHMFDPDAARNARVNLSQQARASASGEHEPFWAGAWRVNDGYLSTPEGAYAWVTRQGEGAWIQLDWPVTVQIDTLTIYPMVRDWFGVPAGKFTRSTLELSNGKTIELGAFPVEDPAMTVDLEGSHAIDWLRLTVDECDTPFVGVAEIVANGDDSALTLPDSAPPAPVNLETSQGVVHLTWQRNPGKTNEPGVAGYRVCYGTSPGSYDRFVDVGNVTRFLMKDLLEDGVTYFIAVKAKNSYGTLSNDFSNEVAATLNAPVIDTITPDHGPVGGGTLITIKGDHFSTRGIQVLVGHLHARDVKVVGRHTITAFTPWQPPGPADVKILNPDHQETVLEAGFYYDAPLL